MIPWQVGSGANFAARVDFLRKLGGWDERLGVGTSGMAGEDIDIVDRLLAAGGSILYSGGAIMHHAGRRVSAAGPPAGPTVTASER